MLVELIAELLGSQLVRAVASEVVTSLASQVIQQVITSAASAPNDSARRSATDLAEDVPRLRVMPSVDILSMTPGRLRARVQGLRSDPVRGEQCAARLRALDGVTSVEANRVTGTLLIHFDSTKVLLPDLIAAIESAASMARPRRSAGSRPALRVVS